MLLVEEGSDYPTAGGHITFEELDAGFPAGVIGAYTCVRLFAKPIWVQDGHEFLIRHNSHP